MTELLIDALAAYRLWKLAAEDLIAEPARGRLYAELDRRDWLMPRALIECPWCLGFWLCCAAVAARKLAPRAWEPLARALAASALAGGLAEAIKKLER